MSSKNEPDKQNEALRPKNRREINSDATKQAIMKAARKSFALQGYTLASLNVISRAAGATTGAVYHHFGGKRELFMAVAEAMEDDILRRIATRVQKEPDPWQRLEQGCSAMLEICMEPEIRQVVIADAPNVIGASEWRRIELKYGFGALSNLLQELQRNGLVASMSVEILARILLGALLEAASAAATAKDRAMALQDARRTIHLFLQSLRS